MVDPATTVVRSRGQTEHGIAGFRRTVRWTADQPQCIRLMHPEVSDAISPEANERHSRVTARLRSARPATNVTRHTSRARIPNSTG